MSWCLRFKDFKAVTHPPYVRLIGDKMYSKFMPAMDKSLGALAHLLTKAENHCTAHNIDEQALLGFRLFPDMFPMTRQVQLTCDFGARTAARLAGLNRKALQMWKQPLTNCKSVSKQSAPIWLTLKRPTSMAQKRAPLC